MASLPLDSNDDDCDNQDILMMLMMMQNPSTSSSGTTASTTIPTNNNDNNSTANMVVTTPTTTGVTASSSAFQQQQLLLQEPVAAAGGQQQQPQVACSRCGVADGCDLRLTSCGCCFHARCFPMTVATVPLRQCPACQSVVTTIRLLPLLFQEMEEAKAAAAVAAAQLSAENSNAAHKRRGQKRKHATLARINPELFLASTAASNTNTTVTTTATTTTNTPTTAAAVIPNHNSTNNGWEGGGGADAGAANGIEAAAVAGAPTTTTTATTTSSSTTTTATENSDLRTGRWTLEETAYCDKLIELFEAGQLPIMDGIKLHDFLAHMLKSKQSRLTKKMKKAKLSSRSYARTSGYIVQVVDAKSFSQLESSFFASLYCTLERSEIRFHIQREWREQFSSYCVAIGQPIDADDWLSSVEDMDRRESQAKDAARMYRRKLMMGYALTHDSQNRERGVHIDPTADGRTGGSSTGGGMEDDPHPRSPATSSSTNGQQNGNSNNTESVKQQQRSAIPSINRAAPFLSRIVHYMQRYSIPFEHVDAWVPSFVHNGNNSDESSNSGNTDSNANNKCRLCFAGCGTTETKLDGVVGGNSISKTKIPLSSEDRFNLVSFGEYSQKFSFDVGCGMPGRVYQNGMSSWEQSIQNAPQHHFERCGGAAQWGIKTVLGIPVPSPNVGRIVVLFYSRYDRPQDVDVVTRLTNELTKLLPAPKWKLVVDIGVSPFETEATNVGKNGTTTTRTVDHRIFKLLGLMVNHMPADKTSPHATYLPGFTSLKLILQEAVASAAANSNLNSTNTVTNTSEELLQIILSSATAYAASGRSEVDIAWMTARDYMLLSQQQAHQQQLQQQQQLHQQVFMADLLGANIHSPPFPSTSEIITTTASNNHSNGNSSNNANLIHSNHIHDASLLSMGGVGLEQHGNTTSASVQMAFSNIGNSLAHLDPNLHPGGVGFNWSLT